MLLALHAAAVSQNLRCVLTSVEPEGPHQLRVSLRRLRVVLRTFRSLMRDEPLTALQVAAREIGSIAGDLRDADVMIDEIIRPAAAGDARLMAALDAWRQEVRGRVRARLLAASAPAFASDLAMSAGTFEWRKRGGKARDEPATDLINAFRERSWERVAPAAARLHDFSPIEIHDLRKDVKALRYAAEIADAVSNNDNRQFAGSLKRVQDALGYVSDFSTLQRFNPALLIERDAFARVRNRLVLDRGDAVAASLARAQALLREIADAKPHSPVRGLTHQIA
ncbi:MAG: CHAD domain-containing protein [Caulobacteraceae bacterium]